MYIYKVSTEGEVRFNASRFGPAVVKISIDSENVLCVRCIPSQLLELICFHSSIKAHRYIY